MPAGPGRGKLGQPKRRARERSGNLGLGFAKRGAGLPRACRHGLTEAKPGAGMWRVMAGIDCKASLRTNQPPSTARRRGASKGSKGSRGGRRLTQIYKPVEHDGHAKKMDAGPGLRGWLLTSTNGPKGALLVLTELSLAGKPKAGPRRLRGGMDGASREVRSWGGQKRESESDGRKNDQARIVARRGWSIGDGSLTRRGCKTMLKPVACH